MEVVSYLYTYWLTFFFYLVLVVMWLIKYRVRASNALN